MKWFRWYRGTTENPKLALVAARANKPSESGEGDRVRGAVSLTDVIAVWAVMLEDAAHKEHWGVCRKTADFVAIVLRWRSEEVQNIFDAMAEHELIVFLDDGIKISKWHEYQYSSDGDKTGAARQQRYYNRHKKKPNAPLTREAASASRPDTDTDSEVSTSAAEVVGEDPKAKLFRVGKTTLVSFGIAEKRTGALLGQWLKTRNDPEGLLAAIQFARDQNVAEPVAYISAVLKQGQSNGIGQKSIGQRAIELADEWRRREREAGFHGSSDDAGSH